MAEVDIRKPGAFTMIGGFNISNNDPIDSRMYVADISHILLDSNWTSVKPYPGLIVADPNGEVRICVNSNYKLASSWKKIGGGAVSVETYAEAVALATADNLGQVIYVSTKSNYPTDSETSYDAAPYIVIGVGMLQKLAASTASGDIQSDVTALQSAVGNLSSTVSGLNEKVSTVEGQLTSIGTNINNISGDVSNLKADNSTNKSNISDLQNKVSTLENTAVTDVKLGVISAVTEGVASLPIYSLEKESVAEDGMAGTYKFYQTFNGSKSNLGTINIPKDQVLDKAEILVVSEVDTPYTGAVVGDKYFKFTFKNNSTPQYLPAKDLIDIYVGDGTYITVDDSNKISLNYAAVEGSVLSAVSTTYAKKTDVTTEIGTAISGLTGSIEDNYVKKETGKGLSTNDYTDDDAAKLAGIETGAQVNVIEKIVVDGSEIIPQQKTVSITYADTLTADEERAIKAKAVYARFGLVDNALADKLTISFVEDLPAEPAKNIIYITETTLGDGYSYFEQNVWFGGEWHVIGTTNFSNYVTKDDLATSTSNGLMSATHYNKLEAITDITEEELVEILKIN